MTTFKKQAVPAVEPTQPKIEYHGMEFLTVCRKIRKFANADMFELDMSAHKSNEGKNIHLFKLIQACHIDVRTFIRGYLANIQPYSLQRFKKNMNEKDKALVCDVGYGVKLLIKINNFNTNKPMIISFHESNYAGSNRTGAVDFSDKPCAVFVNECEQRGSYYRVHYLIVRGMLTLTIASTSRYYSNGVALVEFADIKKELDDTMSNILHDIQCAYLGGVKHKSFDSVNSTRLSFMAFGYATVNNICLLLELFSQYTDEKSRLAISSMTFHLLEETTVENREEILDALKVKYDGTSNKLYLAIKD